MMKFSTVLILLLTVLSLACNRTYDPIDPATEFVYPQEDGKYRDYFVIDTTYASSSSQGFNADTYLKRERADGTEIDLMGREVSKLFIYISPDEFDSLGNRIFNWTYDDLWTQYKGEVYGERIEGNIRYQVLRFPVYEDLFWNGNLYNSDESQTFRYLNTDSTVTIQGVTYENCVVVEQIPFRQSGTPSAFFIEEYAYEIYAPYIGKIKRYYKDFRQQNPSDIETESRVYIEELIAHN